MIFEIVARTPARFLYSFPDMMFLQVDVLKKECRDLGFEKFMKSVSSTCFEIVARTYTRVPQSIPRQMFDHFEEVGLSNTLENIIELERLSCSGVVAWPLAGQHLILF